MARQSRKTTEPLPRIGWREWVDLPDLGGAAVKAKVDTGAKTSAIHAHRILEEIEGDRVFVTFELHPKQRASKPSVPCRAEVADRRTIRNSGGQQETRYVIRTSALIGTHALNIELTLTRRDQMGFRMLLGRDAVKRLFLVDPARSFLHGKRF